MALVLALASCGQKGAHQAASNAAQPTRTPVTGAPSIPPPATGPDAKTPYGYPERPIDPRSLEAAAQVVEQFGALIEENRLDEAAKLWTDRTAAVRLMQGLHPSTHLQIGEAGRPQGAAGSIYTAVPVVFTGMTFRKSAVVILRRVNDVPGSSEAERRWHIARIDWKDPA